MLLIVNIFAAFYFKEIQFDSCLDKVIMFNYIIMIMKYCYEAIRILSMSQIGFCNLNHIQITS